MKYSIKEIYYTLQGEGAQTGRPAVFCRFSGCNLWSGRELDRGNAICKFCDTDFWGIDGEQGGKYTLPTLIQVIEKTWPKGLPGKFIVFTGGEPALQLDTNLVKALQKVGFFVAIETNGTIHLPSHLDWVCVSPKANTEIIVRSGNELKLVYPQQELEPDRFNDWKFDHFYLQPLFGDNTQLHTKLCIAYCLQHPQWKLSLQTHKLIGLK